MEKSKLIQIISSFSPADMKDMDKYLSRLYRDDHKLRRLYDYIYKYAPDYSHKKLRKEVVGRWLFKTAAFRDVDLRLIMSDLPEEAQRFMVQRELKTQPLMQTRLLLDAYRKNGLNDFYASMLDDYQIMVTEARNINEDFFQDDLHCKLLLANFAINQQNVDNQFYLEKSNLALDHYYIREKLRIMCEMVLQKRVNDKVYNISVLEAIIDDLTVKSGDTLPPEIQVYYTLYKLLSGNEDEDNNFDKLINQLEEIRSKLTLHEQQVLYGYGANYCIRHLNAGKIEYNDKIFTLYKAMEKAGVLIENGFISQRYYKNIVSSGIRSKEFDWVKQFIENYRDRLPEEERYNAYTYNLAYYYFNISDYDQTLQLLNEVEFSDPIYAYNAKIILLKTFFEMDEAESLFSLAHAFKQYLKRNKQISSFIKEICMNFTNFLIRIYKVRLQARKHKEALKESLTATANVADKAWLLSKL